MIHLNGRYPGTGRLATSRPISGRGTGEQTFSGKTTVAAPTTPPTPQKPVTKKKSFLRRWALPSFIAVSALGIGAGIHVRNNIPVITSTTLSPTVSGADYQVKTGAEKRDLLWKQVEASAYETLPATDSAGVLAGKTVLEKLDHGVKLLDFSYLGNTFDQAQDVRPSHEKLFHPFGAVAKVKVVPREGHPYTGMFSQPSIGLARLSLAIDEAKYAPGMALKFMVDGKPSVNTIAVPTLDPQESRDFFEKAPTNRFPVTDGVAFRTVNALLTYGGKVGASNELPVDNLAAMGPDGQTVAEAKAPYKLEYRPSGAHFDPKTTVDFRTELGKIPVGTVLYEIWGQEEKDSKEMKHLGDIVTESPFVASQFGDKELNFQHAR